MSNPLTDAFTVADFGAAAMPAVRAIEGSNEAAAITNFIATEESEIGAYRNCASD
jgi:hypothetical protein